MSPESTKSDAPQTRSTQSSLSRRLLWVVLGRLAVATFLLGGMLVLNAAQGSGVTGFTPSTLIGLIVATYAASGSFAFAIQAGARLDRIAWTQIIFDVLGTTLLVYLTGAAGSPFTLLYGIVVLAAAVTLGPRVARSVAGVALLAYVTIAFAVSAEMVPFPPDQSESLYRLGPSELGYGLLSNGVALVLVALLASNLADRLLRAGGRLAKAEASAAALASLNDDIVRSMTTGLLTIDDEETILSINPAGALMFGSEPDAMKGVALERFLPLTRTTVERGETTATRADDTTFPIGFSRTRLRDQDGSLVVFQDLTEIRQLQAHAAHAERLAALGRLASSLAHEIRNPLGSISGSVQMVSEAPELDDEDRELLGIVLKEVERLNALVTSMLDVSRPSLPNPTDVDAAQIAEELASVARQDTTLGSVAIEVESAGPTVARVDPDQIRQLLWNLLKNAIQVSPPKQTVTLSLGLDEDSLVLSVRDRGPGIPEEDRETLFDMFVSKRNHGIGLGLALVKQIVDAHQGTIEVHGCEPGTEMRVRLPSAR